MQLAAAGRPVAKISLTALVDVVFILLFFFMLASRSLDWRTIDVDLTRTAPTSVADTRTTAKALLVLPQGAVHDGAMHVAADDVPLYIKALDDDIKLVLVPAPAASAQDLVDVLDVVREGKHAVSVSGLPTR